MTFYTTGVIYFLLIESTRMENSVQGINNSILTGGNLGEITGLENLISGSFIKHNYGISFFNPVCLIHLLNLYYFELWHDNVISTVRGIAESY